VNLVCFYVIYINSNVIIITFEGTSESSDIRNNHNF
jgi:hypothetical protein